MSWLVPFSSLTPGQQDAVQMDTRSHKAIVGGPGAGKTLVLLHRLQLLFNRAGCNPDAVRLFVYTNSLKQFIRAGNDMLGIPDECISTFDKWCFDTYQTFIDRNLPRIGKDVDFDQIRASVFHLVDGNSMPLPIFEYVLIDEAQDMDVGAIEILKRISRHITVCMDGKQQLYEGRVSEPEALSCLGLTRQNSALLAAFRCNPMVTELAAQFIADPVRQQEFIRQAGNREIDRSRPLLFFADNFTDEVKQLIEMVRIRLGYGDSIAVIFPLQRQVHGFAKGFREAGIEVDVQKLNHPIDFTNPLPKLMTYHQAKGLSFDSVFLPRLNNSSFPGKMEEKMEHLLFVGSSRAVKWVYMSSVNGSIIPHIERLGQEINCPYLEVKLSAEVQGLLGNASEFSNPVPVADEFGLD